MHESSARWAIAAACVAIAAACSSTDSTPPGLGDCVRTNGVGCTGALVSGGGDDGSDASVVVNGSCTVDSSESQCDQCAYDKCCSSISTCLGSTTCANLDNCVVGCAGASACVTACNNEYPSAVVELSNVESCVTRSCAVCSELGIGDPCGTGSTCNTGLTCQTSWCTKACLQQSDCDGGIGPNGGNYLGETNVCVSTSAGRFCAPECGTNTDCEAFTGTFCESVTLVGGATASVCTLLPDGG